MSLLAIQAAIKAGESILEVYNSIFSIELKEDRSPLTLADKNANAVIVNILEGKNIPILSEEGRAVSWDERKNWKTLWMVDPLDGTKEFIKKNGEFTVNIALIKDGVPVFGVIYQPVTGTLFYGMESAAYRIDDAQRLPSGDLLTNSIAIGGNQLPEVFTVVASRSHLSTETSKFIAQAKVAHGKVNCISSGSSLKLCMIAEGKAHVYPRFAPTMEWDTAAGHAIIKATGRNVISYSTGKELSYNKPDLLNDWFIAK